MPGSHTVSTWLWGNTNATPPIPAHARGYTIYPDTVEGNKIPGEAVFENAGSIIPYLATKEEDMYLNLTAVADDLLTVDAAPSLIAEDDEICNLSPITFQLGFEY